MLSEKGKIFYAVALSLVLFGFSFAQEADTLSSGLENLDAPAVQAPDTLPAQPQQPEIQPISLDSVPQGFASQLAPPPAPVPEPQPVAVAPSSSSAIPSSSSVKALYNFYEDYLDSVMVFAKNILPGKQKYEASKSQINEEKPGPKGEYESQTVYNNRIAKFESEKQKKLSKLEKEYEADEKNRKKKLKDAVNFSKDLQPEWAGILKQDTTADGYQNRIAMLKDKISAMQRRTAQVNETLAGLELLSKGELEDMEKKNLLYIARLERACELMQNYILQDYAKVLTTEKKKFGMVLGTYDPDKEEFQFIINDANSFVPFDYAGIIKVSSSEAQEIDRKTDDFLASVDYINYPFITRGEKLYPGAKKAHIFYKDKEISNAGYFKNVSGFDVMEGYVDWAIFADSLISGKLKPKLLDSSYAMKKVSVGPPYWNAKRILRATAFVASATSLGLGIWQNSEAKSKAKSANKLYGEVWDAAVNGYSAVHFQKSAEYDKKVDSMQNSEYLRNGLYISAGVFGVAGLVTFAF